jgi:hypothetical protein
MWMFLGSGARGDGVAIPTAETVLPALMAAAKLDASLSFRAPSRLCTR